MPFDDLRSVVAVVETHDAELSSIQRGREGGGVDCSEMDPSSTTERTSTTTTVEDSEAGTSPIDVSSDAVQLNDICPVDDSVRPEAAAVDVALESSSCNKSSKRDQGDLMSGRVDNGPTASTSKAGAVGGAVGGVIGGGGVTPLPESLRHPRKSLPLLPRMSQYERHPLLQVRSGTGMSEFELFLLEKEIFRKRCSVDDQHPLDSDAEAAAAAADADALGAASSASPHRPSSSSSVLRGVVQEEKRIRLIPRSAHYEPHPLLRKSISGVCELELYLMEKEEEVNRREREVNSRDDDDNDDDDDGRTTTTKGEGSRRWKLEPRLNQWEKHALLEVKDKSGLSEVDRFFLETEQQQQQQQEERGKCGAECVCKSATCKRCKKQQQQKHHQALQSPSSSLQQSLEAASASSIWKGDSSKTSEDSSSSASATAASAAASAAGPLLVAQQKPSGQPKRVHFERQKNEADDSGIASSDVSCQATRQDDVSAPEVSLRNSSATYGRQTKSDVEAGRDEAADDNRKSQRGKAFRTDKQTSGNKSCCMS